MERKNIRYGMAILSLVLFAGAGPGLLLNTFSTFVKPIADELGVVRSQVALVYTIELLLGFVMTPVYGKLLSRANVRNLMLLCGGLCVCILLGYSFAHQLWQFYLLAAVFGLAYSGICFASFGTLITRWFAEKKNLVTGIAFAGTGILPALVMPVINRINAADWRQGYRLVALMAGAAVLLAWLLIRNDPAEVGLEPYGGRKEVTGGQGEKPGDTYGQACGQRVLWVYLLMSVLAYVVLIGINQNCVAYLSDLRYDPAVAGMAASVLMLATAAGKILSGGLYDRFSFSGVVLCVSVLQILSPLLLLFARYPAAAFLAVAINGAVTGATSIQASSFVLALFGERDYSRIYALVLLPNYIGSALGPALVAGVFDRSGSYRWGWGADVLLSLMGLALAVVIGQLYRKKKAGGCVAPE